jgi:hypothetical protein
LANFFDFDSPIELVPVALGVADPGLLVEAARLPVGLGLAGQVVYDAPVSPEADEPGDAPDGEALAADRPEPLALDVDVREEAPADREEGVEGLLARLDPHQVHLAELAPHDRERTYQHGILVEGLPETGGGGRTHSGHLSGRFGFSLFFFDSSQCPSNWKNRTNLHQTPALQYHTRARARTHTHIIIILVIKYNSPSGPTKLYFIATCSFAFAPHSIKL